MLRSGIRWVTVCDISNSITAVIVSWCAFLAGPLLWYTYQGLRKAWKSNTKSGFSAFANLHSSKIWRDYNEKPIFHMYTSQSNLELCSRFEFTFDLDLPNSRNLWERIRRRSLIFIYPIRDWIEYSRFCLVFGILDMTKAFLWKLLTVSRPNVSRRDTHSNLFLSQILKVNDLCL